ncbi:zinc finger protein 91 [Episyrphus balteatus]|uniref:zinc finger protein 91 n=1 Tax=Episyrphus balteatus TaxID=286459 RepID=UPI0024858C1C|nr:zinc finger protein 91 [Episyrphus balteatus]
MEVDNISQEENPDGFSFDEIIAFSPEIVENPENVKQITAFQCSKCDFIDCKHEIVQQHQKLHDKPQEDYTEVVVYVCSLCYGQYNSVEDLRGHMIEFHKCKPIKADSNKSKREQPKADLSESIENNPKVVVGKDEKVEKSLPLLPVPLKEFKLIIRRNLVLKCTFKGCSYKLESDEKLQLHLKCHKEGTPTEFKCSECGIDVENWRRCSLHLLKAHRTSVGLLQCPLCSYSSSTSARIWRHMITHRNWKSKVLKSMKTKKKEEKPPPPPRTKYYAEKTCDICNRKFVSSKTLSKHVKSVHNKIKPFICNVCGLKTTRKSVLAIHMRQHTGEKPLACKVCKFRTRDPSTLRSHEMRHGKNPKQKCKSCDKSFIQAAALKRHIRTNHPEEYKKISCELCNYVTISAEKLAVHMGDHSKGLIVNNEDSLDASRQDSFKNPGKFNVHGKHIGNAEISSDCFLPLDSVDSMPHVPAVDTGGVTIPAPSHSEDTQFPTFLNS